MENYKIVFIGTLNETLIILSKGNFLNVVGTNYFEYFDKFTINPFDLLYLLTYKLHYIKKFKNIKHSLLSVWNFLYFFSSDLYKNNKEYLNCIIRNNIEIINTEDINYFSSFILENKIDLIVLNSWSILPNDLLNLPKYKTINIHPSLLPKYRGSLPTLWSLKNKDNSSAVTYIVLNDKIDEGIVVAQHLFLIDEEDDWYSLEVKISTILKNTLVKDILNYLNNKYQKVGLSEKNSVTGFYNKYRLIDLLNEVNEDIYNKVGLYPYLEPYFYCYIKILNKNIYIKRIFYFKNKKSFNLKPGELSLYRGCILFFTRNGMLKSRLFIDISLKDSIFLILSKITKKL